MELYNNTRFQRPISADSHQHLYTRLAAPHSFDSVSLLFSSSSPRPGRWLKISNLSATRRSTRNCTVYLIIGTLGTLEARLFSLFLRFLKTTSLFKSTCPSPGHGFCLHSHAGLIISTYSTIPFALAAPPPLHPFGLTLMIFSPSCCQSMRMPVLR
ncbi:hypothetical protein IE81DRAFT_160273 [Ceraceosorus guamensis]|uniref:Uncharacterized protein n=1 Tax=Ceraceosorus guamensis TaxID=1522189 RepID=A0A316VZI5_9BASI|nr:hypothetical protein IE81DRAFT_160273 [Ceraceosorus guamensis]PWN41681.1 hypothetical protein IE81DRAFT_160273 [Ceraceosorus guamensis]